ncbi:MAG: hypothetical protein AB8G22_20390, partial [Saprospiraceae bacterium]
MKKLCTSFFSTKKLWTIMPLLIFFIGTSLQLAAQLTNGDIYHVQAIVGVVCWPGSPEVGTEEP